MVITEAHVSALLERQQLLHLLLDAARDVLVDVDEAHHARAAEGDGEVLDGPRHGEARVRVLVVGLEVVHVEAGGGGGGGRCEQACGGGYMFVDAGCGLLAAGLARAMLAGRQLCRHWSPLSSLSSLRAQGGQTGLTNHPPPATSQQIYSLKTNATYTFPIKLASIDP